MDEQEKLFHATLYQLAKVSGEEIGEAIIAMIDQAVAPFGYAQANVALQLFAQRLKHRWRVPMPGELLEILNPEVNPESEAVHISGQILLAIAKFGPYQPARAREYLGETAWTVVQQSGGWEQACCITDREIGTHRAQWKQLAHAKLVRGEVERGLPQLRKDEASDAMKRLGLELKKLPEGEDEK